MVGVVKRDFLLVLWYNIGPEFVCVCVKGRFWRLNWLFTAFDHVFIFSLLGEGEILDFTVNTPKDFGKWECGSTIVVFFFS
ncbi:hypothetical protein Hanom_Chr09g00819251 [Helianthus anomalus]